MSSDNTPPLRARPSPYAARSARPPGGGNRRQALRFLALPILAIVAAYLFYGLRDYFELPKCDSDRAKQSLSQVLKELKLEPTRLSPITTVSSSKDKVVCNAVLPLPDNATVVADFTFYWQSSKVQMKYSISKKKSATPSRS
jgi:hypothetical protein